MILSEYLNKKGIMTILFSHIPIDIVINNESAIVESLNFKKLIFS
jgi:hypothetical protein